MTSFGETLHGGEVDPAEIQRVRDVVIFEEPGLKHRLVKFWVLLVLAAGISTYGLLGNSVATIIGAMIVAPLMLPIVGLAFAISIADRKAIVSSLVVAVSGIVLAIGVGYVLTLPFSGIVDPTQNAQIMSRTAPRLIDLAAALATGLAGAFAIGRADVSDTLPGVAIAISLVPPLANVGILLATGRPDLAWGSMLLFITNYLAIVLTGALMFGLMRYPNSAMTERSARSRAVALATVAIATVLILVPLTSTTWSGVTDQLAQGEVAAATRSWLKGSGYRMVSVTPDSRTVQVVIAGQGPPPSTSTLQGALRNRVFGKAVSVQTVPETSTTFVTE